MVVQEGSTSTIGRKSRHCYFAFNPGPTPKSLRHPKVGDLVSVTVHSGQKMRITTRVRIRFSTKDVGERRFSTLLGCRGS